MKTSETQGKISCHHFLNCSAAAGAAFTRAVVVPLALGAQTASDQAPDAVTQPTKIYAEASSAASKLYGTQVNARLVSAP